jgi:hypothetical protein
MHSGARAPRASAAAAVLAVLAAAGCASAPAPVPAPPADALAGLLPFAVHPDPEGTDLPPVEVRGAASEEQPVGPYGQPDWTTRRRFARSRVYVLAPGQWEVEGWYRGKYDSGHTDSQLWQAELGVGLPYRFQVDYYQNFKDAPGAGLQDAGPQLEGRWAFADWGKIPGNPTIYGEYKWDTTGADKVEAKLLLGDTLAPRVHAAANLILEQETSGERETELAVAGGMSYSLVDGKIGVGAEATYARLTAAGSRDDPTWEAALGPSVQWRFARNAHLDVVPMFGLNKDAHGIDLFLVIGYDFGATDGVYAPTSRKSR